MIMLCFATPAKAQLNVTKKTTKAETITTARTGLIALKQSENVYYASLLSTNKFDDSGIFFLGKDKESALATLKDLSELYDNLNDNERIEVKDISGNTVTITKGMTGNLILNFPQLAGICYWHKSEIKKFAKALEK